MDCDSQEKGLPWFSAQREAGCWEGKDILCRAQGSCEWMRQKPEDGEAVGVSGNDEY
jgi:hypothetical protein